MKELEINYWRSLLARGDGGGLVSYPIAQALHEAGAIQVLPPEPSKRKGPYVYVRLVDEAKVR